VGSLNSNHAVLPVRIVVVEDIESDVRLLRLALQELGEEAVVEVLKDGEEALQFVHDHRTFVRQPDPCVIVLDLHLPKYDGIAVLRAIRQEPLMAHIRVVVLTTSCSPQEELEVRRMGVRLYRRKPSNLDEFIEVAREILSICKEHAFGVAV
jgi:two-component system, chemotaxis family, response regulator Rcp1